MKCSHEGIKDHKCELCGRLFSQKGGLKRHLETCKKISVEQKKQKVPQDQKCNTKTKIAETIDIISKLSLPTIHINALQIQDHKCEICEKYFAEKSALKSHLKKCKSNQKISKIWECEKFSQENINSPTVEIKTEPNELNQKIIKQEYKCEYWSNETNNMESFDLDDSTIEIKMEPIG